MKQRLGEQLSPTAKLALKRLAFAPVRAGLRLAARAYRLAGRVRLSAEAHGLDWRRAWDVKATPRAPLTQQWGTTDFLFLMDAISGRSERLDPDRPVKTSVVMLCYNKADLTFQSLRSLVREVDLSDAEIIVVNNASRDETRRVLDYFGGHVRAVHSEVNLGFVHGCNEGARVARGRYLVFINNDTVVLPGWLENLVAAAEGDPRVGAAGSMFIYPDWTLQEAGGIVWRDAGALQYGRGKSPEDPRFNFAREVDYCSGASLLVRKDLFDRLGGFDARYAPIYYEDVDICMGVRALGYKVVYQPASRIVHFEGATSGTDTRTGLKRHQVLNRVKFHEKWREVLEREHHPQARDAAGVERAANRKSGAQVIVFDDHVPAPDRDAGSARMAFILKSLSERCHTVFVSTGKGAWPEYERLLWKAGVETAGALEYRRLLKERNFVAAVISRPVVAEAVLKSVRRASPRTKVVFDMVDAHFIRFGREAALTGDAGTAREAEAYRRTETWAAQSSDLLFCVSEEERGAMQRWAPHVPAVIVPTVHPPRARGLPFGRREHLLFVGNFAHRPNADSVHLLVREILPLVRETIPSAELLLVGSNAPPEIEDYSSASGAGVRLLGYVPDLDPLYASARVFVAPIRFGAGVKGKIGEALSYGLPVVTTPVGAEGMSLRDGEEALIAEHPRDLAAAIVRAYNDPALWQRLSDQGHAHVSEHFAPDAVGRRINEALGKLLARARLD